MERVTMLMDRCICKVLFLLAMLSLPLSAHRVLLFPALGGGHVNNFEGLAEELARQGHQVYTLFTETKMAKLPASMKEGPNRNVILYDAKDIVDESMDMEKITAAMISGDDKLREMVDNSNEFVARICRRLMIESEPILKQLESLDMDVVVVDGHFTMRCAYLLPHRLNLPVVSVVDVVEPWLMRLPYMPSYVPLGILPFSDQMTFSERLLNLVTYIGFYLYPMVPEVSEDILRVYSRYGTVTSTEELARNTLLWLHTADPVVEVPKPSMPNMISVGGLSPKEPQPVPQTYLSKIENSEHEAILVSFGSNIKMMPKAMAEKFLRAFAQVKQTVIWRFTNVDGLQMPDNVMISDWVPQKDLLAHPKVRLFLTHCGNGGQHESLYHGVPMIGFPVFGDQPHNAARMERRGYGIKMDLHNFTSEELLSNIRTIFENPQFKENTHKAADIMQSRPQKPNEMAVYWINHFLKYGNYLHSHAIDMPLYQFLMVDLILTLVASVLCSIGVSIALIWICCHIFKGVRKLKSD